MIDQLLEEMHAKVLARVPMTLTLEEINEVLKALDRPFVHPGVPELSTEVASDTSESVPEDSESASKKSARKGKK